jgi:hypothetical protein
MLELVGLVELRENRGRDATALAEGDALLRRPLADRREGLLGDGLRGLADAEGDALVLDAGALGELGEVRDGPTNGVERLRGGEVIDGVDGDVDLSHEKFVLSRRYQEDPVGLSL